MKKILAWIKLKWDVAGLLLFNSKMRMIYGVAPSPRGPQPMPARPMSLGPLEPGVVRQQFLVLEVTAETYKLVDYSRSRTLIETVMERTGSGESYTVSQEIFRTGSGVAEINELVAHIRKGDWR